MIWRHLEQHRKDCLPRLMQQRPIEARTSSSASPPRLERSASSQFRLQPVPGIPTFRAETDRGKNARQKLPSCSAEPNLKLVFVFDPSDASDLEGINSRLLECLVPYQLHVQRLGLEGNSIYEFEDAVQASETSGGLIYRRPAPYLIEVRKSDLLSQEDYENYVVAACSMRYLNRLRRELAVGGSQVAGGPEALSDVATRSGELREDLEQRCADPKAMVVTDLPLDALVVDRALKEAFDDLRENLVPEQGSIALLPNHGPRGIVPFRANSFVTTDYKVEFKDGMPIKWRADRPSEVASVVRIPVAILRAILQIPAELIKLRFDIASNSRDLANANLEELCASTRLAAAQTLSI